MLHVLLCQPTRYSELKQLPVPGKSPCCPEAGAHAQPQKLFSQKQTLEGWVEM